MHRWGQNVQKLGGKTVGRDEVKKGWLRESRPQLPRIRISLDYRFIFLFFWCVWKDVQGRVSLCVTLATLELTL